MRTLLEQGVFNQDITDETKKIVILSGEGEIGTYEEYDGNRTVRAIKTRLKEERCDGDRWARVFIYSHTNVGDIYTNMETGEQIEIDEDDII